MELETDAIVEAITERERFLALGPDGLVGEVRREIRGLGRNLFQSQADNILKTVKNSRTVYKFFNNHTRKVEGKVLNVSFHGNLLNATSIEDIFEIRNISKQSCKRIFLEFKKELGLRLYDALDFFRSKKLDRRPDRKHRPQHTPFTDKEIIDLIRDSLKVLEKNIPEILHNKIEAINSVFGVEISDFRRRFKNFQDEDAAFQKEKKKFNVESEAVKSSVNRELGRRKALVDKKIETLRHMVARALNTLQSRPLVVPSVEKLPWTLLPSSENSVPGLSAYFEKLQRSGKWMGKIFDESRLERIHKGLNPSKCYIGNEGFDGYIAYCFDYTGAVILECPFYGNAIYILKDNWKSLSKLPKWEAKYKYWDQVVVINHTDTWFERLKENIERL